MSQEQVSGSTSLTQRVATEIRAELGRQKMSQTALAQKLGVDQSVISRRLIGERYSFTTSELDRVAEVLSVPVEQLLGVPLAVTA